MEEIEANISEGGSLLKRVAHPGKKIEEALNKKMQKINAL
jgi:hypothetical protein